MQKETKPIYINTDTLETQSSRLANMVGAAKDRHDTTNTISIVGPAWRRWRAELGEPAGALFTYAMRSKAPPIREMKYSFTYDALITLGADVIQFAVDDGIKRFLTAIGQQP